jgi:hypothetical protein
MHPTPEQVAQMTEALPADFSPFWDELPQPAPFVHETEFNWQRYAAAILATLPDDWCGHIGVEEAIAQGQRMLAERDATIARLRKIEEAARALMVPRAFVAAIPEPGGVTPGGWEWPEWHALRAALAGQDT